MPAEIHGGVWGTKPVDQDTLNGVEFDIFYPRVHVYKNLLPNVEKLVDILKKSSEDRASSIYFNMWDKWFSFGETISGIVFNPIYPDLIDENVLAQEKLLVKELEDAFAIATQHYMQYHNVTREDHWTTMGPSICKYISDLEHSGLDNLSMAYHTDYDFIRGDEPGDKFAITCTMYLNDDYEGGEVWFYLKEDGSTYFDSNEVPKEDVLIYKPSAGDLLVFPSGHPDVLSDGKTYFHGVSRTGKSETKQSDKLFIRSYHLIPFPGTDEWLANREKYGAEVWEKMETERIKARVKTHAELQLKKTMTDASGKECGTY